MTTRFQVLRGARAGASLALESEPIRIGRDPDSDLRFDPDGDLEVSARHALFVRAADGWIVRDLGSTNGTFLNGRRIDADAPVRSGDRVEFGAGGPIVEVSFDAGAASRTQELRVQYAAGHRRLRWIAAALGVALVAASVALVAVSRAGRRERLAAEAERAQLRARIDSLLLQGDQALASLRGEMDGLAEALRRSRAEVEQVRTALDRTPAGSGAPAAELERQLRVATEALKRQQLAASLDFRAIERSNRHAVALVFVEAQDGTVATATAFAARPDGMLLTAAHLLAGADGTRRPRRIAVQFSDSEQFFPARLVRIAETADIAAIALENLIGAVPVVAGFNLRPDTMGAGAPVALIGFPLGGETTMPGAARSAARPLVTAGIVTSVAADRLEVRGYGAAGASGSPILDGDGKVLGILFGGRVESGQSVVVAVPARAATELLEQIR